ncbi:MAG TPA: methylated-DNA--[protein]-cysteine S-methyltransferase [Solirubrobacterales bacterium]|nr:methylated-DNA--[protein]-cysteine S-methyltransferase [Solirubrobacterales bacterium]
MDESLSAPRNFTLFETALGWCGVAWQGVRITAVELPAADPDRVRARLRRAGAGSEADPPHQVAEACGLIASLLAGEPADLRAIPVAEEDTADFERNVYAVTRTIPPGDTLTYGEIANRLGDPALAREVGAALGRNPTPLVVPCHRVVAADGRLGGFSAPGGQRTKRRLLEIEGAITEPAPTLFAA